jgi:hypothetical protein
VCILWVLLFCRFVWVLLFVCVSLIASCLRHYSRRRGCILCNPLLRRDVAEAGFIIMCLPHGFFPQFALLHFLFPVKKENEAKEKDCARGSLSRLAVVSLQLTTAKRDKLAPLLTRSLILKVLRLLKCLVDACLTFFGTSYILSSYD